MSNFLENYGFYILLALLAISVIAVEIWGFVRDHLYNKAMRMNDEEDDMADDDSDDVDYDYDKDMNTRTLIDSMNTTIRTTRDIQNRNQ